MPSAKRGLSADTEDGQLKATGHSGVDVQQSRPIGPGRRAGRASDGGEHGAIKANRTRPKGWACDISTRLTRHPGVDVQQSRPIGPGRRARRASDRSAERTTAGVGAQGRRNGMSLRYKIGIALVSTLEARWLTKQAPGHVLSLLPIPTTYLTIKYPTAWIGGLLLLEVPIDRAALHETARRSAHRADDDFLVLEGGCEGRIRLFYKNSERKRLEVGAVGAVQIRRGSNDASVIFGQTFWLLKVKVLLICLAIQCVSLRSEGR
ncbi:uncharacterized protein BDR25DRAFT_363058 [Lindgomyces ingoldianus]|uniref:Uncharacterized protein n=1 Tax=Lindgomyces ingoldianus TaxID=673940 RepID=A0ACB6Q9D2_9PLEO|nr:uncharacterized protein BDR25DRAFT_363058 [Lindgomyces ingoldianus]KAF2463150.1 hypothetical protein BDR25DRAFT_363058 [Lindgomyces ingoldianus]